MTEQRHRIPFSACNRAAATTILQVADASDVEPPELVSWKLPGADYRVAAKRRAIQNCPGLLSGRVNGSSWVSKNKRRQKRPAGYRAVLAAVTLGCADLMIRGFLVLTRHVSEQRLLRLAPVIGQIMRRPSKDQTIGNMKLFLRSADWSEARWEQLWKAHTRHVGQTVVEFITWYRLPAEELLKRISIRGEHHFHEALRGGRGVMVLASHLGNFLALAPCLHKLGAQAQMTGQRMPTPFLAAFLDGFVKRYGTGYLNVGEGLLPRAAAKSFRNGAAFSGFVDISAVGKRDVWLRFGRAETNVSIGPVLLARRHRVPVLCVSCRRMDATRHEVTFHPPLSMPVSADGRADARRVTAQALELIGGHMEANVDQWWQWDRIPLRLSPNGGHCYGSKETDCGTLADKGKMSLAGQECGVIW